MSFEKKISLLPQVYQFLFFTILSLIVFIPTATTGFTFDYVGWAEHYKNGTYAEAINSFGYNGLHPVLHITSLTLTKLFGIKSAYWYLFMSFLHGANAFMFFKFLSYLLKRFKIDGALTASLFVSVLFLIHPYNIEPVVWRACVHYLISFFCIISSLYFISRYFEEEHLKHYVFAILLYVIALFSLEISYATGILWFFVALTLNYLTLSYKYSFLRIVFQFLIVPFSFLGAYLLLTYLKIGSAIGHYGAEEHLEFQFLQIVNNAFDYLTKHLLFARDFKFYDKIYYQKITSDLGLTFIVLITGLLIFLVLTKVRSLSIKLSAIFLILFGIALSPIVNLYFYNLLLSQNDRYGYLASPFIITSFVLIFWHFKNRLKWIPLLTYFSISCYCFINLVIAWNQSEVVFNGLLKNFNYHDKKEVILLNVPDNYKGIFLFRVHNHDVSAINEALDVLYDNKYDGKLRRVAEYSMLRPVEKVAIRSDTTNHINVIFSDWGSWWIKNGYGALPYENDRFAFSFDRMSYDIQIKGELNPDETVILYSEGDQWKEVDINAVKSNIPTKLNDNEGVY